MITVASHWRSRLPPVGHSRLMLNDGNVARLQTWEAAQTRAVGRARFGVNATFLGVNEMTGSFFVHSNSVHYSNIDPWLVESTKLPPWWSRSTSPRDPQPHGQTQGAPDTWAGRVDTLAQTDQLHKLCMHLFIRHQCIDTTYVCVPHHRDPRPLESTR